jgi:hypothetical protein
MDRKEMKKCFACLRNEKSRKQTRKEKTLGRVKSSLLPPWNVIRVLLPFKKIKNVSGVYEPSSQ